MKTPKSDHGRTLKRQSTHVSGYLQSPACQQQAAFVVQLLAPLLVQVAQQQPQVLPVMLPVRAPVQPLELVQEDQ